MTSIDRNSPCPCGSGKKFKKCCGALDRRKRLRFFEIPEGFDPQRIRTVHFDDLNRRVFVTPNDVFINQLVRDSQRIAASFDRIVGEEVREISCTFSDALGVLVPQVFKYINSDDAIRSTSSRLLLTVSETLVASAHLARAGFKRQYGLLARSTLETLATVLQLCSDLSAISRFHDGKLDSAKAILYAKKIIPELGDMYGWLSKSFVHTSSFHSSLSRLEDYESKDEALNYIIYNLKFNTWFFYVVTELVFLDGVDVPRYWRMGEEQEGGTCFTFEANDKERQWMDGYFGLVEEEASLNDGQTATR